MDAEPALTELASPWQDALRAQGYAFVDSGAMRRLLAAAVALSDWPAFAASWNDLALDTHMADHGRYRRRRHAVFTVSRDGTATRAPHQPHYQSREYNALNGGIARWFEPVANAIADGATLRATLRACAALFGALTPAVPRWRTEVHQFRIEARAGEPGQPTPEGVHRDGVDWVLVLLIARNNIASGTTTIHDADGRELGAFTLTQPFDAALVDDHRCHHGVTAVTPLDPSLPAHRDVLVVTFTA